MWFACRLASAAGSVALAELMGSARVFCDPEASNMFLPVLLGAERKMGKIKDTHELA